MAREADGSLRTRWIEVWPDVDVLYVMTREADTITNVVADGLAKLLARGWKGEVEE
jgi:hypothetical protein